MPPPWPQIGVSCVGCSRSALGYGLSLNESAASYWAVMHAAVTSQMLLLLRSQPLAAWVRKAFIFAAALPGFDEAGTQYALWWDAAAAAATQASVSPGAGAGAVPRRTPLPLRSRSRPGLRADVPSRPVYVAYPAAAAYATAAAMADVTSGRSAGVGGAYLGGNISCLVFAGGNSDGGSGSAATPSVVALWLNSHFPDHVATVSIAASALGGATVPGLPSLTSGVGAALALPTPSPSGDYALWVSALPQFVRFAATAPFTCDGDLRLAQ